MTDTTTQTLSTRLRAAADDLAFVGRPDPHDDQALLREAADALDGAAGLLAAAKAYRAACESLKRSSKSGTSSEITEARRARHDAQQSVLQAAGSA